MKEEIEKLIAYLGHRRLNIYPDTVIELNKLMTELEPGIRKIISIKFSNFRNKYTLALNKINMGNDKVISDEEIKQILGDDSKMFFQDIDLLYIDLVFSNPYVIEYYEFFAREENE